MQVLVTCSKLYDALQRYHNTEKTQFRIPLPLLSIKDSNGEQTNISAFVKKENEFSIELTCSDGYILKVGSTHILIDINLKEINAEDIEIGQVLSNGVIVTAINKKSEKTVYDFQVDATDHLYQLPNGTLHHNTHNLPKNAFLIYASNLNDEGVEQDIPLNTQFEHFEMEDPSKEEWFSWLMFKFQKNQHVKINKAIINKFYNILEDEDISNNDIEADVRVSPRRWEQLILYINASIPCKDIEDAKGLLSNVKLNFRNYLTGDYHEMMTKVMKATAELIKQTSGIEVNEQSTHEPTDWKETLRHQIEAREKLGTLRKYIPVLSGLPGVSKTARAISLAKEMNLRFIDIDVSTLNAEDVVGLPLAKEDKKAGTIETEFSLPVLYQQIMERIKAQDQEYLESLKEQEEQFKKLKAEHPSDWEKLLGDELQKNYPKSWKEELLSRQLPWAERWADYQKKNLKYLVFFDEMNRNTPKVFNAMRRVLLEKNFGHGAEHGEILALPKETLMLGAVNPIDAGAQPITKHMRDVLDIIDTPASWDNTISYMKGQQLKDVQPLTHDVALDIVKKFVKKFETKDPSVPLKERAFHWDVGMDVWISPREINMMFLGLSRNLEREIKEVHRKSIESLSAKELTGLEDDVRRAIFNSLKRNTSFVFTKQKQSEMSDWYGDLKAWCMNSSDIDIGENIFYHKAVDTKNTSLMDIIEEHFDNINKNSMSENDDFINFMANVDDSKFREDLTDMVVRKVVDHESAKKYFFDDTHPMKVLKGKKISVDPERKVCMIQNFILETIYALWINKMSNSKITTTREGIFSGLKAVRTTLKNKIDPDDLMDIITKLTDINSEVADVVEGLVEIKD